MKLGFTSQGWADYQFWQLHDRAIAKRVNRLIDAAMRDPASGIGRPEVLKYELSGVWSRRITLEHRLVYEATAELLTIWQCRFHY